MDKETMKSRTKRFGLAVMEMVEEIPKSISGKTIAGQIVRSGTSVGANYRAATRGRSKEEFAAKIGISLEECDETAFWLEMRVEGKLLPKERLSWLIKEADELCRILYTTRQSSKE